MSPPSFSMASSSTDTSRPFGTPDRRLSSPRSSNTGSSKSGAKSESESESEPESEPESESRSAPLDLACFNGRPGASGRTHPQNGQVHSFSRKCQQREGNWSFRQHSRPISPCAPTKKFAPLCRSPQQENTQQRKHPTKKHPMKKHSTKKHQTAAAAAAEAAAAAK
jgi:hypothetical protein